MVSINNEQRKAPRAPFSGELLVYRGNDRLVCHGLDISVTGMRIAAPSGGDRSQFVRVLFMLPGSRRWVQADGVVVRLAGSDQAPAWGVQFLSISEDVSLQISEHVQGQPAEGAGGGEPPGTASARAVEGDLLAEEELARASFPFRLSHRLMA